MDADIPSALVALDLNGLAYRVQADQNPFSSEPEAYAASRPRYPADLIAWVISNCSERNAAWDCGTGSGQAAIALAEHFALVHATDISAGQLETAFHHPKIAYSAQPAERTNFVDASFDLVTVAQALHWFDFDSFWAEVKRVAKPDGFFCAWGYSWFEPNAELDAVFLQPLLSILMPYFDQRNQVLWKGYPDEAIRFPFKRVSSPFFSINLNWSIDQLVRYVRTWSAFKLAATDESLRLRLASIEEVAQQRLAGRGPLALEMRVTVVAGRVP